MTQSSPLSLTSSAAHTDLGVVDVAPLFKALGDPLRLRVLRLLKGESLSVSELCDVFKLRQSALSHHLKILVQADLIVRRREGTAIFYRRALPSGSSASLVESALQHLDTMALDDETAQGMALVQVQREQNSLNFFKGNQDRFREQQELIASWQDYSQATLHLLDHCGDLSALTLVEIGPGDGALLSALSERAASVIALDTSEAMLREAQHAASACANVHFIHGDTHTLIEQGLRVDVAVANMVLHHTPDPRQVLQEATEILRPGGWLVISELCRHDQAWAREHCGDVWLGFDPQALTHWAADCGLDSTAELFIAQRNGFQIQVRLFQKPTNYLIGL